MLEFSLQEKRFILFLLTTFLAGCAVLWYRQSHGDPALAVWREQVRRNAQTDSAAGMPRQKSAARSAEPLAQPLLSQKHRLIARLNINTATAEELASLERIGPAMAARIVRYREEHGPFQAIEQVQQVKGIGPKTFARIRDQIGVE
ncbi:MAG TPA: helix-hairpin-helix domain-containing protein [bacterium]|nr:helix-hairpin-helix domain-containing protein [bacterium]HQG44289.1 helix-hairpin-helix domain-containing protein [bacterium]HQI47679.1 helix-hairpin-helix domain-containing protein [bacterium]HQJ63356.1 helix-hairpin-helix domain-containing protein [bacterium]